MEIIGKELQIIFPVHPRTKKKISELTLKNMISAKFEMKNQANDGKEGLFTIPPVGYIDFIQ